MGVVLRNLQKVVPLRRARLRRDVDTLRHILGIQKFDLGIICVDNRRIQQINSVYRKKDAPTDVLSFPFYEAVTAHGICHLLGYRHETEEEWTEEGVEINEESSYCAALKSLLCIFNLYLSNIGHPQMIGSLLQEGNKQDIVLLQMLQRERYILAEFNRLTGRQLEPLMKPCGPET
ncbi:hypothetical protein XENOCAPTIV_019261 [Xenoophorus captivus]|uniref:Uncharacterized protein n=1 Tax=Xenoophorus captivus TaxID=1517983 RepID=A0ABV0QX79_9TELE